MHKTAVINYKGGVGKTTITANLAAELAYRGKNVLMVDLDPQASLTFSFVEPDYWERNLADAKSIKAWFDAVFDNRKLALTDLIESPRRVKSYVKGKLDLIASHLGLINVDLELATQLGGASLSQVQRNFFRVHRWLLEGLKGIAEEGIYDVVLIDCPPNFNIVTKNAIVASDGVVIPARPDYLSTLGIDYLYRSIRELVKTYNGFAEATDATHTPIDPHILGVVFTMIRIYGGQPIAAQRPAIRQTKKLGVPVFDAWLRDNKTLFGESPQHGVPVVINRYSQGTYQDVVGELENLAHEFQTKARL